MVLLMSVQQIVLVGSPNSGKSALFGAMTGAYAVVSNYPGTTVELTRGKCVIENAEFEIIDTPGMYSLVPITEEERIARNVLEQSNPYAVVQVINARNIERGLHLTVQLLEAGLPLVIALNVIDETKKIGWEFDTRKLSALLGVPVIPTVAIRKEGVADLLEAIGAVQAASGTPVRYAESIESFIDGFTDSGENGHLAFNDPPADFDTEEPYLIVNLDEACRRQQVGEGWFKTLAEVPRQAISMSIRQILKAKKIVCIVPDLRKAAAVKACVEGPVSPSAPASILQTHPDVTLYLDAESASQLHKRTIAKFG